MEEATEKDGHAKSTGGGARMLSGSEDREEALRICTINFPIEGKCSDVGYPYYAMCRDYFFHDAQNNYVCILIHRL